MKHCVSPGKTGRLETGWLGSPLEQAHHRRYSALLNVVRLVMDKQISTARFDSAGPKCLWKTALVNPQQALSTVMSLLVRRSPIFLPGAV